MLMVPEQSSFTSVRDGRQQGRDDLITRFLVVRKVFAEIACEGPCQLTKLLHLRKQEKKPKRRRSLCHGSESHSTTVGSETKAAASE